MAITAQTRITTAAAVITKEAAFQVVLLLVMPKISGVEAKTPM